MSTITQGRAGTPGPDRWIRHEAIKTDAKAVNGYAALYDGGAVTNAVDAAVLVVTSGASRGRLRFKSTVGGTLKWRFVRPTNSHQIALYEGGNPADVTVTAGVETFIETTSISGEAQALIIFTPSGTGTVSVCDWSAL